MAKDPTITQITDLSNWIIVNKFDLCYFAFSWYNFWPTTDMKILVWFGLVWWRVLRFNTSLLPHNSVTRTISRSMIKICASQKIRLCHVRIIIHHLVKNFGDATLFRRILSHPRIITREELRGHDTISKDFQSSTTRDANPWDPDSGLNAAVKSENR